MLGKRTHASFRRPVGIVIASWLAFTGAHAADAARQYGTWHSASFGGGGYLQNLVIAPSNPRVLYTHVDVGGVYRSDDGGRNWRMLHGSLPAQDGYYSVRGLAVSPANPDHVVIALGNQWSPPRGVFLSRDGGATWTRTLEARFFGNESYRSAGTILAWPTPETVYAATAGDGLWRSDDGGKTWQKSGMEGVNATDLDFAADGRGWLCAAAYQPQGGDRLAAGLFHCDATGAWRKLADDGPNELVLAGDGSLAGVFNDNEIRQSRDGGATWQGFSEGLPVDPANAASFTSESRFQALAAGPDFLLCGSARGTIYRRGLADGRWSVVARQTVRETVDGRPWWGRMQPGKWPHFGASMGSIVVVPGEPRHWWFSDWYGLYESTDAGASWDLRINGIEVTVIHSVTADPQDPAVIHASMADNAYARSTDGGVVFETGKPASNFKMIAISPKLPGRLYAAGDRAAEWRASCLWVSPDQGKEWVQAPAEGLAVSKDQGMNTVIVHPARPYEVYVAVSGEIGAGGGVFRSNDGGGSFAPLNEGWEGVGSLFRKDIWAIGPELAITASGKLVAASHERGTVYRRADGRWIETRPGAAGKPRDLIASGETVLLAMAEGGLWKSTDGGASWLLAHAGDCKAPAIRAGDEKTIAFVAKDCIRLSNDGGASWRSINLPPHGMVNSLAFAGGRLVAATAGGGLFRASLANGAERPLTARATPRGLLPVKENVSLAAPDLGDGTFATAEAVSSGWSKPWLGRGLVTVDWNADSADASGGSLRIRSDGGSANGSTGRVFPAVGNRFRLAARWKTNGDEKLTAKIALRSSGESGQLAWQPLLDTSGASGGWQTFDKVVSLAKGATQGELVLVIDGEGELLLDAIDCQPYEEIFGTPLNPQP